MNRLNSFAIMPFGTPRNQWEPKRWRQRVLIQLKAPTQMKTSGSQVVLRLAFDMYRSAKKEPGPLCRDVRPIRVDSQLENWRNAGIPCLIERTADARFEAEFSC